MKKTLLISLATLAFNPSIFADCRPAYQSLKDGNNQEIVIGIAGISTAGAVIGSAAIFAPNPSLAAPILITLPLAAIGGTSQLAKGGASWSSMELSSMMAIPQLINEAELGDGQTLRSVYDKMLELKIIPATTTLTQIADKIVELNDADACLTALTNKDETFWDYRVNGEKQKLDTFTEFFYKVAHEISK